MRLTNSMVVRSTLGDLGTSLARLQSDQAKVSTGKAFQRVSDEPNRASDALALRQRLRRNEQLDRSADDTEARLRTADSTLLSTLDVLNRVKELTVRASNEGASTPTSRGAIAAELRGLRSELLGLANASYLGRPLFNGTAAGPAYDVSTGAYLGDSTTFERPVADGVTLTVNVTGEQVFGAASDPAGDLFAVIDRLATAVATGDGAAISQDHANLETATLRVGAAAAEIGRRASHLESVRVRADRDRTQLEQRLSQVEDVDLAEALISMQASENAYQATLQTAARVLPPSLVDYLR